MERRRSSFACYLLLSFLEDAPVLSFLEDAPVVLVALFNPKLKSAVSSYSWSSGMLPTVVPRWQLLGYLYLRFMAKRSIRPSKPNVRFAVDLCRRRATMDSAPSPVSTTVLS